MRLSATQKDVLFVLYAIGERQSGHAPVPSTRLYAMINNQRNTPLHASNFRASCHTLHRHGLLAKYRDGTLKLAFLLSAEGNAVAADIYQARLAA